MFALHSPKTIGLIAAVGCFSFWNPVHAAEKPNILLILVDDWGYGDYGVFHQAMRAQQFDRHQPWHMTPSVDAMAAQGMRLPHHYCSAPVCAPSRASLLTGVHQGHSTVRDNQFDKVLEDNHTIPRVLRSAGYATMAIGKYGLQGEASKENPHDWPAHPNRRGFDEFYGYMRHVDGHEHYPKNGITKGPKQVWHNDVEVSAGLDNCYTTDLFTARAKESIVRHVRGSDDGKASPFFLFLAYDTPHAVLTLPTGPYPTGRGCTGGLQWMGEEGRMINTADGIPDSFYHPDYESATWDDDDDPDTPEVAWPDVQKRYATLVRRIDDGVGDLLQTLKDLEIDDHTLVVFTTDNGPSLESYLPEAYTPTFFDSFGTYEGTKRDVWEGGIHVGAIARWPAKIEANTTSGDHATTQWDWLPTFADAAGVRVPARCDGVSLLPLLLGQGSQPASRVYVEYFQNGRTPAFEEFANSRRKRKRNQMQMIREDRFVGVRTNIHSHADAFEIYDVVDDPGQRKDLAASMPELQQSMQRRVLRMRVPNISAPRPYDNVAVPPVDESSVSNALKWNYVEGSFAYVPRLTPGETRSWESESASRTLGAASSGVKVVSGFLEAPTTGTYRLRYQGVGKAIGRVHEATVLDADYGYTAGKVVQREIVLGKGFHPMTVCVLVGDAGGRWSVEIIQPDGGVTVWASSD